MRKELFLALWLITSTFGLWALPSPALVTKLFPLLSDLPAPLAKAILENPQRFMQDVQPLVGDPLLILADKKHALPSTHIPADLVPLEDYSLQVSRKGLSLKKSIIPAALALAQGAKKAGITLVFSSTYRSWIYQKQVFDRYAAKDGPEKANTYSARPGESQHQLGTVVDFGDITLGFANTKAGKWMAAHSQEYGWSLSFPQGYDQVTGYQYEPWHFRYIGVDACKAQKKWFGDIQQYMLTFLHDHGEALKALES